jgi:hypothetical protein
MQMSKAGQNKDRYMKPIFQPQAEGAIHWYDLDGGKTEKKKALKMKHKKVKRKK